MNSSDFKAGTWQGDDTIRCFIPEKIHTSYTWNDSALSVRLERAAAKLGELQAVLQSLPDSADYTMMLQFSESVNSANIDGIAVCLEEVVTPECVADPAGRDNRREIANYVDALNNAAQELKTQPLNGALLRTIHWILLASGRGQNRTPGAFRSGFPADARFVPPPDTALPALMGDLEQFVGDETVPVLVRSAIAYYQFETIHPFLDGNGRMARILVLLLLSAAGMPGRPVLQLSSYLVANSRTYDDVLIHIRERNDLNGWLSFFFTALEVAADKTITALFLCRDFRTHLEADVIPQMGKRSGSAQELLAVLFKRPVITIKDIQDAVSLSPKAAGDLAQACVELKIIREVTNRQRNRIFVFSDYLRLLGS